MKAPKEFTTEKGTTLYYSVNYSLGGYNYFTGEMGKRGYFLNIQRNYNSFCAFTGIEKPGGAIKRLLIEVKRQSKKAEEQAEQMAEKQVAEIVAEYNRAGYEI